MSASTETPTARPAAACWPPPSVPEYTVIIPTCKRPDVLALCLERIAALDYPLNRIEVYVIDNGGAANSRHVAEPFRAKFPLTYLVNEGTHGMYYSLNRGLGLSRGAKLVTMNDDALVPPDFLRALDVTLAADPAIGCIGVRALEKNYHHEGSGIGLIDDSGAVVGNFDQDCGEVIEVEHVYGFCYLMTREALWRAGLYDRTLLARDYSSGNRAETDHCLSIRRHGLKVVYNPAIAVEHLARPRPDYNERSLKWKLNHTRNTLYLFLKHYGLFGKRGLALRFAFLHDVGILSAILRPTRANIAYFLTGLRGRLSAFWHYSRYLAGL